jgi:hypothetical protein
MSKARLEILKMIHEGKISPEDGENLIDALDEGYPKQKPKRPRGSGPSINIGRAFDDAAQAVKTAAREGVQAVQKVFEEHRPGTVPVTPAGGEIELPDGATLRIHPAFRLSMGGTSAGGGVTIRGIDGNRARVIQGSAIEIHRLENEYVLSWAKSNLELEVPRYLGQLSIRGFGGNVDLSGYRGPFRVDGLGGNFSVEGAHAPFRIRSVGGSVRIRDLDLKEGTSSITTTGGDVEINAAPDASVEIRAKTTLGGSLSLPDVPGRYVTGRRRRRGSCVLGMGEAKLRIETVAGWIRVHSGSARETDPDAARAYDAAGRAGSGSEDAFSQSEIPAPPGSPRRETGAGFSPPESGEASGAWDESDRDQNE